MKQAIPCPYLILKMNLSYQNSEPSSIADCPAAAHNKTASQERGLSAVWERDISFARGKAQEPRNALTKTMSNHIIRNVIKRKLIIIRTLLRTGGSHAFASSPLDENLPADETSSFRQGRASRPVAGAAEDPRVFGAIRRTLTEGYCGLL